jgi:hypothetical protein
VGALGVIGRCIVERLFAGEGWEIVGLSRRAAPEVPCHWRPRDNFREDRAEAVAVVTGRTL